MRFLFGECPQKRLRVLDFSPSHRSEACHLLEEAAEVGWVAQPAGLCDFRSGLRRLGKKFLGFVDADAAQVFAGGLPGVVLEQGAKRVWYAKSSLAELS